IETLQRHGINVSVLREDVELDAVGYRIASVDQIARPFEGHRTVTIRVQPGAEPKPRKVEAGTVLVRTAQPLGSLALFLLEPESAGGLATWHRFDEGLVPGTEFPALRLESAPASPLLLAPPPALPEERAGVEKKRVTFDTLLGGRRPTLSGRPASIRWLD